ncbi:MAG: glutathione S-transferase family protein [Rhizomicrobium sp.]
MAGVYRIFGSEMSPYSVKVRSYFRYKAIPHEWIARRPAVEEEYKKYARLPIVPTVATPDDEGIQDSTPILERLEAAYPEPSIHPADPALKFLSRLFEEFGDEWGNKLMFHHRWWAPVDRQASAQILARLNLPHGSADDIAGLATMILARMSGRGGFVGSSAETAPLIAAYYFELLDLLEPHLQARKYLFGARPAFGDFGLAAQLYESSIDPTCGGIIRARGPHVLDWCYRMNEPRNDGGFEDWETLKPTMEPLLRYVGRYFLPWTRANAAALKAGAAQFSVDLDGKAYVQAPQKYHAKSQGVLEEAFRAVADKQALLPILEAADCLRYLA